MSNFLPKTSHREYVVMLILGEISLLFYIVNGKENRLKINITPYGEIVY